MKWTRFSLAVATCALLFSTQGVSAADWGDLELKLVYDGTPPAPAMLNVNKDPEACSKPPKFNESLVVNKENKGIANIFVMLVLKAGEAKPAVHPDYAKTEKDEVIVDNAKCRFEPHATIMRTTQTLILKNSDAVGHNTKAEFLKNAPINPIIPSGGQIKVAVPDEERLPIEIACSIHPWMSGRLIVRDNPYYALSDKDGKVSIKNLPAGKWNFMVWHEIPGFVQEAKQGSKAVKWAKGRMDSVTIKKGPNDQGTFTIPAAVFVPK